MQTTLKRILLIMLLLVVLGSTAYAAENSDADEVYEQSIEEIKRALPDSVSQYLDEGDTREEAGVINSFIGVLNDILGDLGSTIKAPLRLFGVITAVLLLCSAAGFFTKNDKLEPDNAAVSLVGSLAISGAMSFAVVTAVDAAISAAELAEQFIAGFIPVFAGLMVSSGQITSAAVLSSAILGAAAAASSVITLFVKPLTGIIMGLALVSGVNDSGLYSVADGIKKTVMWVMGIISSVFVGLMGLQGTVSGQSDNLTMRTTKYLVGSSIPIIGSAVSEAVATVSYSFKIIKATVGAAGIVALCGIFLPEIIQLVLCSAAMSFSAIIGDVIGMPNLARSVRAVKGAIDIMTAILAFYFVALAVCTAIMIKTGGA